MQSFHHVCRLRAWGQTPAQVAARLHIKVLVLAPAGVVCGAGHPLVPKHASQVKVKNGGRDAVAPGVTNARQTGFAVEWAAFIRCQAAML